MPTIALTGNFGMGKSTVLKLFKDHGAVTLDVDAFVHEILKKPEILIKIRKVLGDEVVNDASGGNCLNKKVVARIVFNNEAKRKALESIVHPEVLTCLNHAIKEITKTSPSALIIVEVPLLFESGFDVHFDKSIVTYCDREIAITRLAEKGVSSEEAAKRLDAQMPVSIKKIKADFIIDNSKDLNNTREQTAEIYSLLVSSAF